MIRWKVTVENEVPEVTSEEVELASRTAAEVWLRLGSNEKVGLEFIKVTFFRREGANYAQIAMAMAPKLSEIKFEKIWVMGVLCLMHVLSDDKISRQIQLLVIYCNSEPVATSKFHTDGKEYASAVAIAETLVKGIKTALLHLGRKIVIRGKTLQGIADSLKTDPNYDLYPAGGNYRYLEEELNPSKRTEG